MMRVVERREWLEGEGADERARREIVFADPHSEARYTIEASPATFDAHPAGLEVALSARTPEGGC